MSDWGATHDSAAENANAGLDMEQPGDNIIIGEPWASIPSSIVGSSIFQEVEHSAEEI